MKLKQTVVWLVFIGLICAAPLVGTAQTESTTVIYKNYTETVLRNGRVKIVVIGQLVSAPETERLAKRLGTTIENIRAQNPTKTRILCSDVNGTYTEDMNPYLSREKRVSDRRWDDCPIERRGLMLLQGVIWFTVNPIQSTPVDPLEDFKRTMTAEIEKEINEKIDDAVVEIGTVFTKSIDELTKEIKASRPEIPAAPKQAAAGKPKAIDDGTVKVSRKLALSLLLVSVIFAAAIVIVLFRKNREIANRKIAASNALDDLYDIGIERKVWLLEKERFQALISGYEEVLRKGERVQAFLFGRLADLAGVSMPGATTVQQMEVALCKHFDYEDPEAPRDSVSGTAATEPLPTQDRISTIPPAASESAPSTISAMRPTGSGSFLPLGVLAAQARCEAGSEDPAHDEDNPDQGESQGGQKNASAPDAATESIGQLIEESLSEPPPDGNNGNAPKDADEQEVVAASDKVTGVPTLPLGWGANSKPDNDDEEREAGNDGSREAS